MRLFDLLAVGLVVGAFVMVYRLFAADAPRAGDIARGHTQATAGSDIPHREDRGSSGMRGQTSVLTRIEHEVNGFLDSILPNSKKPQSWTIARDTSSWRAEDETADAFDPIVAEDRTGRGAGGGTQVRHGSADGARQTGNVPQQDQTGGGRQSGQADPGAGDPGGAGAIVDLSAQISPSPDPARWRRIIIHHSGTSRGNVAIFDRYHKTERRLADGLVYHFVIGNGTDSDDGFIEEGPRWRKGIGGPQTKNTQINNEAIGICLVGDFDETAPSEKQKKSLKNLISYLCACYSIRTEDVLLRSKVPGEKISSPGRNFSME
ncbi:MAG: peptidoglycan recognition family protein [Planctomycetota bacterium]|nr:peptidoglycan recognition family protein [Planctomycetota bacterium]